MPAAAMPVTDRPTRPVLEGIEKDRHLLAVKKWQFQDAGVRDPEVFFARPGLAALFCAGTFDGFSAACADDFPAGLPGFRAGFRAGLPLVAPRGFETALSNWPWSFSRNVIVLLSSFSNFSAPSRRRDFLTAFLTLLTSAFFAPARFGIVRTNSSQSVAGRSPNCSTRLVSSSTDFRRR